MKVLESAASSGFQLLTTFRTILNQTSSSEGFNLDYIFLPRHFRLLPKMRKFIWFGLVWGISVVSGTIEFQDGGEHFEPTVAMYCPEKGEDSGDLFYNKYLAESGVWMTDTDSKATCVKDKVQILEYCKKVYPERDITNIGNK